VTLADDASTLRLQGRLVYLETPTAESIDQLAEFDWARSSLAEMGGWFLRPPTVDPWATMLFYEAETDQLLGVLDAGLLPGYPGVVNLSIFTDSQFARPGLALHAYGLYVEMLFNGGVRLVHHEVLEFNLAVRGILRRIGVEPSARYREHAFAAGRLRDVLIYAYDQEHFQREFARYDRRVERRRDA